MHEDKRACVLGVTELPGGKLWGVEPGAGSVHGMRNSRITLLPVHRLSSCWEKEPTLHPKGSILTDFEGRNASHPGEIPAIHEDFKICVL